MHKFIRIVLFIFILIQVQNLFAQVHKADFEIHDRGNLWETVKDDGTIGAPDPTDRYTTYPSMDWPGGPHELIKDEQRSYLLASGMWIGGKYADNSIFFTENGPLGVIDPDGTFEEMTVEENFIGSIDYNPNEAEQIITANWMTGSGIRCKRTSRAWSFRNHNNSIIMEYTFSNSNTETLNDVYFGFVYIIQPSYQDYVVHNGWDDSGNLIDEVAVYDPTRKLIYAYDDIPSADLGWDYGNYWDGADELRTTGYAGYALLSADQASNGSDQPSNVQIIQLLDNAASLSTSNVQKSDLYDILSGTNQSLNYTGSDKIAPFMLMACGPYNIEAGETVHISLVEAVNGLPVEEAVKGQAAQENLEAGLDSLQNSIDRAKTLYDNDYQLSYVAPPSPELQVTANPEDSSIVLTWTAIEDSWVNPISGRSNASEYIMYVSERSFNGPFEKVRARRQIRIRNETDREKYYKEDLGSWQYPVSANLGVGYFFAVTTLDSAGHESWITNRNVTAVKAGSVPRTDLSEVNVFPNPFREVSGFPTIGQENYIVWTNLPAKCTIRIYTSSGELIKTLEHNNANSGDETWEQTTDARQRIAPGIYFWTVESKVGSAKGSLLVIK